MERNGIKVESFRRLERKGKIRTKRENLRGNTEGEDVQRSREKAPRKCQGLKGQRRKSEKMSHRRQWGRAGEGGTAPPTEGTVHPPELMDALQLLQHKPPCVL